FERQSAGLCPVVMAGHTVVVEKSARGALAEREAHRNQEDSARNEQLFHRFLSSVPPSEGKEPQEAQKAHSCALCASCGFFRYSKYVFQCELKDPSVASGLQASEHVAGQSPAGIDEIRVVQHVGRVRTKFHSL